jgi:ABC-type phosphate/phosphonate transport system substrate-binding protein
MKAKIVQAFIDMMKTDAGKAAMKDSYQWSDVIEKDDSFYDGFRQTLDAAGVKIEELAPK